LRLTGADCPKILRAPFACVKKVPLLKYDSTRKISIEGLPMNRIIAALPLSFFACEAKFATAQTVINFETTPSGGTPSDELLLNTPYAIAGGGSVRFFYDTNGNSTYDAGIDNFPIFEAIGDDPHHAFEYDATGQFDVAAPGYESELGNFFLQEAAGSGAFPFVVQYNSTTPIAQMSGQIWDIDGRPGQGTEQWRVDVLNTGGNVVATLTSPLGDNVGPTSLDGKPWNFSFSNLPPDANRLLLTFIGTKSGSGGYGLDNFGYTVAVPEPSGFALACFAALSLVLNQTLVKTSRASRRA
jgi:hypothetical protein